MAASWKKREWESAKETDTWGSQLLSPDEKPGIKIVATPDRSIRRKGVSYFYLGKPPSMLHRGLIFHLHLNCLELTQER